MPVVLVTVTQKLVAELAVPSLVVAETIASTHCATYGGMARLSSLSKNSKEPGTAYEDGAKSRPTKHQHIKVKS